MALLRKDLNVGDCFIYLDDYTKPPIKRLVVACFSNRPDGLPKGWSCSSNMGITGTAGGRSPVEKIPHWYENRVVEEELLVELFAASMRNVDRGGKSILTPNEAKVASALWSAQLRAQIQEKEKAEKNSICTEPDDYYYSD